MSSKESERAPFGSPEVTENPYPFYDWTRRECPVYRVPGSNDYLLTRYDDIVAAARNFDVYTHIEYPAHKEHPSLRYRDLPGLADNDPPDHGEIRKAVMPMFSPARIREYEPMIQAVVDELIAAFEGDSQFEFIRDFAIHIPPRVLGRVLGLPAEDHERLNAFAHSFSNMRGLLGGEPSEALLRTYAEFCNYCGDLVVQRRANPGSDPVSALATVKDANGEYLAVEKVMSTLRNIISGGANTTILMMASGIVELLQNRAQLEAASGAAWIEDDRLWLRAIDEILRKESPAQYTGPRYTREDYTLHGVTIPKGCKVMTGWGAANRDPEKFAHPERFDLDRDNNREHIAFGVGVHFCPGASLARAEALIAFKTLFRRFPNMRLSAANDFRRQTLAPKLRTYEKVIVEL